MATKNKSSKKDSYSNTAFSKKALANRSARTGKTVKAGDAVDSNDRGNSAGNLEGMKQQLLGAQESLNAYKAKQTIGAADDMNATPLNIPTATQVDVGADGILAGLSSQAQNAVTNLTAQQQKDQVYADRESNLMDMLGELGAPPSQEKLYKKAQQETGILDKQQEVSDLSGQLNSIVANAQANQLKVVGQGRGIPEAIIGGQQAEIGREAAIASLPVAAQLEAAQGNLEMAQQNLNTLFAIKSADATNKYTYKKDVLKSLYDIADEKQKDKLAQIDLGEKRKYEEQQAAQAEIKQLGFMALQNGAPASVLTAITSAKTYAEALKGAGSYGTNPLDQQLKRLQIAKAQQDLVPDSGGKIVTIDGKSYIQNADGSYSLPVLPTDGKDSEQYADRVSSKISTLDGLINDKRAVNANAGLYKRTSLSNLNNSNDWQADAINIIQKLTVDELGRVKVDGVTFGQLSNGERAAVGDAATALSAASIKDAEGNPTGKFKMSEAKVVEEFKKIQDGYKLDFERRTGQSYDDYIAGGGPEQSYITEVENALQTVNNPYAEAGYLISN